MPVSPIDPIAPPLHRGTRSSRAGTPSRHDGAPSGTGTRTFRGAPRSGSRRRAGGPARPGGEWAARWAAQWASHRSSRPAGASEDSRMIARNTHHHSRPGENDAIDEVLAATTTLSPPSREQGPGVVPGLSHATVNVSFGSRIGSGSVIKVVGLGPVDRQRRPFEPRNGFFRARKAIRFPDFRVEGAIRGQEKLAWDDPGSRPDRTLRRPGSRRCRAVEKPLEAPAGIAGTPAPGGGPTAPCRAAPLRAVPCG